MKQTINEYEFCRAFHDIRPDNFSREGLCVLFEYLEQYEEDTGAEVELDVIALCCDFSEDTVQAIADNYRIDLSECEDDDDKREAVKEWLDDEGAYVGETAEGFVYRNV